MPNPTSSRVYQRPKGAGACLAGLNKLFFGDLTFGESVLTAVLHRSQHRPGSPKQAQTWPDGSTYSIVQETPAFAETGPIYFGLWCAENGVLSQFSHSLFIEIPSRDSLLARTEIKTRPWSVAAPCTFFPAAFFEKYILLIIILLWTHPEWIGALQAHAILHTEQQWEIPDTQQVSNINNKVYYIVCYIVYDTGFGSGNNVEVSKVIHSA